MKKKEIDVAGRLTQNTSFHFPYLLRMARELRRTKEKVNQAVLYCSSNKRQG